ncbi:interferon-induced transmembrane protein 3-like [Amphiura filiformis]|uniref:interferon-induced transmembrane protein 3-like n=1 Tax=Amphiura filiformis TaxID=82378 RepID=UPI003B2224C1
MESNIKYDRQFNEQDQLPPPYEYSSAPGPIPGNNPYITQGQNTTVVVGPGPVAGGSPPGAVTNTTIVRTTQEVAPPTYMVWSILNTIFFCFVFGIVAIIKSNEVSNHMLRGDIRGALQASNSARAWNIAATVTGIILIPVILALRIIADDGY